MITEILLVASFATFALIAIKIVTKEAKPNNTFYFNNVEAKSCEENPPDSINGNEDLTKYVASSSKLPKSTS